MLRLEVLQVVKVKERFEFANPEDMDLEKLVEQLKVMYTDLSQAINQRLSVFIRATDGLATDTRLSVGDININSTSNKVEMLTNFTSTTNVTWTTLS